MKWNNIVIIVFALLFAMVFVGIMFDCNVLKPALEEGQIWISISNDDNPFIGTDTTYGKIIEIKKGYVRYKIVDKNGKDKPQYLKGSMKKKYYRYNTYYKGE